jgi:hypothetical protein
VLHYCLLASIVSDEKSAYCGFLTCDGFLLLVFTLFNYYIFNFASLWVCLKFIEVLRYINNSFHKILEAFDHSFCDYFCSFLCVQAWAHDITLFMVSCFSEVLFIYFILFSFYFGLDNLNWTTLKFTDSILFIYFFLVGLLLKLKALLL